MNALRSALGSCWSRANAAGDTSRTGCEKTAIGQLERLKAST